MRRSPQAGNGRCRRQGMVMEVDVIDGGVCQRVSLGVLINYSAVLLEAVRIVYQPIRWPRVRRTWSGQ